MKAMILAAGYGTRLGDLTRDVPKPMLDVQGSPLLAYIVAHLRRHGFDDLIINLHYQPEVIRSYFGDGTRWGVRITYSYEENLLGTAGGLKNAAEFFSGSEDFLVHYGDVVTDANFTRMYAFHRSRGALATLLVHRRPKSNSIIHLDAEDRITRFVERPANETADDPARTFVNSGVCVAHRDLLDLIPAGETADLPRDIYTGYTAVGRLFAYPLTGYRCAVDSAGRLDELRATVGGGRLSITPSTSPAAVAAQSRELG